MVQEERRGMIEETGRWSLRPVDVDRTWKAVGMAVAVNTERETDFGLVVTRIAELAGRLGAVHETLRNKTDKIRRPKAEKVLGQGTPPPVRGNYCSLAEEMMKMLDMIEEATVGIGIVTADLEV